MTHMWISPIAFWGLWVCEATRLVWTSSPDPVPPPTLQLLWWCACCWAAFYPSINGKSRILKWRYRGTRYLPSISPIFSGYGSGEIAPISMASHGSSMGPWDLGGFCEANMEIFSGTVTSEILWESPTYGIIQEQWVFTRKNWIDSWCWDANILNTYNEGTRTWTFQHSRSYLISGEGHFLAGGNPKLSSWWNWHFAEP